MKELLTHVDIQNISEDSLVVHEKPQPTVGLLINVLNKYYDEPLILPHLFELGKKLSPAHLRWQLVRTEVAPLMIGKWNGGNQNDPRTGFEGYAFGYIDDPEEVLKWEAKNAQKVMDRDVLDNPYSQSWRRDLVNFLHGEKMIPIENVERSANLFNMMRVTMKNSIPESSSGDKQNGEFRARIYNFSTKSPPMEFKMQGEDFVQTYKLPQLLNGITLPVAPVNTYANGSQEILSSIGVLGNPLVRIFAESKGLKLALMDKVGYQRHTNFAFKGSRLYDLKIKAILDNLTIGIT